MVPADHKRGQRKVATSTNVKKHQKSVNTNFHIHRQCVCMAKNIQWHNIARQCDTIAGILHIARYLFKVSHRHICAIPHFAKYRAISCAMPGIAPLRISNKHKRVIVILSLQASPDMKSIAADTLQKKKHQKSSKYVKNRFPTPSDKSREGVNHEKLTVKKIINNEMFFFSPFMSLINREKLSVNREKSAPKIHHFFTVSFFTVHVFLTNPARHQFSGLLIECFRGRHRGGRLTSFLRFSGPFLNFRSKMSLKTPLKLAPPLKRTPWSTPWPSVGGGGRTVGGNRDPKTTPPARKDYIHKFELSELISCQKYIFSYINIFIWT